MFMEVHVLFFFLILIPRFVFQFNPFTLALFEIWHLRLSSEFNILLKDPTVNLKTEHVLKGKKLNTELLNQSTKIAYSYTLNTEVIQSGVLSLPSYNNSLYIILIPSISSSLEPWPVN